MMILHVILHTNMLAMAGWFRQVTLSSKFHSSIKAFLAVNIINKTLICNSALEKHNNDIHLNVFVHVYTSTHTTTTDITSHLHIHSQRKLTKHFLCYNSKLQHHIHPGCSINIELFNRDWVICKTNTRTDNHKLIIILYNDVV